MSFKDFRVMETIGKGSFASVYKVIRKSDNKIYALKRIKINKMSKREISDSLNEIRFLASIRHQNIVGFLEAFLENNETELCIIMEYCGCGDLAQKVERYKRRRQYIDENVIWRYLIQSLKALEHLHEKGICHRDLKTANSFLAEDGAIKIGDMNVSKRLKHGRLQTQIGTPYYMSPEIWSNRPYDWSSDMWSLGCMIYELCALKPPFTGDSFPQLKRSVLAGRYAAIPKKYSEGLGSVISAMLKLSPRERLGAGSLLRHPEVARKLYLDGPVVPREEAKPANPGMMNTIKVPQNMKKLNQVLPKPCYADLRPNSPTMWTFAEQAEVIQQKKDQKEPVTDPVSEAKAKAAKAKADAIIKSARAAEHAAAAKYLSGRPGDAENAHPNAERPKRRVPVQYEYNNQGRRVPIPSVNYQPHVKADAAVQPPTNPYRPGQHHHYANKPSEAPSARGYYDRYSYQRGAAPVRSHAAGQPSRAYPRRMW